MKFSPGNLSFRSFLAVSRSNLAVSRSNLSYYGFFFSVKKFFGSLLYSNRFHLYT